MDPTPKPDVVVVFNLYISNNRASWKGYSTDKLSLKSVIPTDSYLMKPLYDVCL